jgi:putative GTP pyrophosphokinase
MQNEKILSTDELKQRAMRFFDRYGADLEQIKSMLQIRLEQLALAYTLENKLPAEAVRVSARVKTVRSFLKKLEAKGWPQFYYPSKIAGDLVGARVVCWFVDDCEGFLELIRSSSHLKLSGEVEDYMAKPKSSGYRSIHCVANIAYDGVRRKDVGVEIVSQDMVCEIQIRSKLQDAWADITHEFHYKAKNAGVENADFEALLCDVSERLATEDKTLIKFRKAYLRLADTKTQNETREGFRS